jgi:hypothetical protein
VADVLFVALLLAFFAVCVAYVSWCDRMIGPDPSPDAAPDDSTVAAPSLELIDPVEVTA